MRACRLKADGAAQRRATLLCHGAGEAHVLTEFYSSRTLRNLVLSSADGAAVPFVKLLWAGVFKDRCQQFVGEHPTVVEVIKLCKALLECGCENVKQAAHEQLEVGVARV
jgi:hypothetical protein